MVVLDMGATWPVLVYSFHRCSPVTLHDMHQSKASYAGLQQLNAHSIIGDYVRGRTFL